MTAPDLLAVVRRIESRGAPETARRVLQYLSRIGRFAVATGRAERDAAADLRGALPPANKKHFSTLTDPKDVAALLRAIDTYQGSYIVLCALKLAPLVFVRPGELRKAEWAEFNLDEAEWRIPAERMRCSESGSYPTPGDRLDKLRTEIKVRNIRPWSCGAAHKYLPKEALKCGDCIHNQLEAEHVRNYKLEAGVDPDADPDTK